MSADGYVVTGGGRGVGRAVVERLLADGGTVAVVERDEAALDWLAGHPNGIPVVGSAADPLIAERAADLAERLVGWVNNAAVFRDASVHSASIDDVVELVAANLNPAIVGSAAAIRRFLAAGTPGAIVNVSSHQAGRAVPGCTPYVTAKAGVEGLTRALAAEYGESGIRVNTVALGTIATERWDRDLAALTSEQAERVGGATARLHALGRVGAVGEVADAVAYLLSERASFVSGVTLPVDGGRAILAREPQP